MAVAVKPGAMFQPSVTQELFATLVVPGGFVSYRYAVAADGKRFLMIVPVEEAGSTPVTVVLNWAP